MLEFDGLKLEEQLEASVLGIFTKKVPTRQAQLPVDGCRQLTLINMAISSWLIQPLAIQLVIFQV